MILTLPMAKLLKEKFKNIKVYFLGSLYTRDVVEACSYSDGFIEMDYFLNNNTLVEGNVPEAIIHVKPKSQIAKRARKLNIKWRIGTTNRLYHWATCNQLIRLNRKNSTLHEAQLNLKLLKPLGIDKVFSFNEIADAYGLTNLQPLQKEFASLIKQNKYNLILHPKSRGNAREWPLKFYIDLIQLLDAERYNIFISGVEADKPFLQPLFDEVKKPVTDIVGKMPLGQFISFIAACDGLVACSTGPLHIAAAVGINAYGIYVPIKPMHPQRWAPIGKKAHVFCLDKYCSNCKNNIKPCTCIIAITPQMILNKIEESAALNLANCINI